MMQSKAYLGFGSITTRAWSSWMCQSRRTRRRLRRQRRSQRVELAKSIRVACVTSRRGNWLLSKDSIWSTSLGMASNLALSGSKSATVSHHGSGKSSSSTSSRAYGELMASMTLILEARSRHHSIWIIPRPQGTPSLSEGQVAVQLWPFLDRFQ